MASEELKILNLAAEYLRENDVHVDERENDYYHVHSGLYDHYNGKPIHWMSLHMRGGMLIFGGEKLDPYDPDSFPRMLEILNRYTKPLEDCHG
jgi:hypothetical protein